MSDEEGGPPTNEDEQESRKINRKSVLFRAAPPSEETRRTLDKKMTLALRGMARDISKEVRDGLSQKYDEEKKTSVHEESVDDAVERLQEKRNLEKTERINRRTLRDARKSLAAQAREEEEQKLENMSAEEKAALARKARKTAAFRTGGLSEFLEVAEGDNGLGLRSGTPSRQAARPSVMASRQSVTPSMAGRQSATPSRQEGATPSRQVRQSRYTVGTAQPSATKNNKKALLISLSPIATAVSAGKQPLIPPQRPLCSDDITLLSMDDILLNERMRRLSLPAVHFETSAASDNNDMHLQEGRYEGMEPGAVAANSEAGGRLGRRTARQTVAGRLAGALKASVGLGPAQPADELPINHVPIGEKASKFGVTFGSLAADATFSATTNVGSGAGFVISSVFKGLHGGLSILNQAAAPTVERLMRRTYAALDKAQAQVTKPPEKKITREERARIVAAKVIQKNFRVYYYKPNGPRDNRAARIITAAFREYASFITHEKWNLVIGLELKERRKREIMDAKILWKKSRTAVQMAKIGKLEAEKVARKSGWGAAQRASAKWTKKDESILVACNFKFGYPFDDPTWGQYYKQFPDKPKRAVRAKLSSMKEDDSLNDFNNLKGCPAEELDERGLGVGGAASRVYGKEGGDKSPTRAKLSAQEYL